MKVFAQDPIALDFALTAGFKNVFKGLPTKKATIHSYNNPNHLPEYLLNYKINLTSNYPRITDSNIKNFDINFFDLYIFPWYEKDKGFIKKILEKKKTVIFYGTEEKSNVIKRKKIFKYLDQSGTKWEYLVSPLVSYKFFYEQLKKNKIKTRYDFEYTKKKYQDLINFYKRKWESTFGKPLPSIAFMTKSSMKNDCAFIYSPGFLGAIYNEIGFSFKTNKAAKNYVTGDGITLNYSQLIKKFKNWFLFVFVIDYYPLTYGQKNQLFNLGKIISKAKSFFVPHELVYAQHGIIGIRHFLETIDKYLSKVSEENKAIHVLRIENAFEAMEFYKEKLGFIEEWKYFYPENEKKYKGKLLRAKLWFWNIPIFIAEINKNKTQKFLSFEIVRNPFEKYDPERVFKILAKGGKVLTKLEKNFTGDTYGEVIDKFDVHWEIKIKGR